MTIIRGVLFGSAAMLLASGGAQAADLPLKAKAVEYVKICTLYGAGFYYIPGTDTCVKLGGYLRADTTFNGGTHHSPNWNSDNGQGNRYVNYFNDRSRMAFTVDTRTATEYGVVRTFGQAYFQFSTLGGSRNPNTLSPANTANLLDTPGGGYAAVSFLFIQFAGFTFGKSASAYATPWQGNPGNNTSFLLGGHDTTDGVNNIQYKAEFGNGVSASVGLDDPTVFNRTSVYNLGATPLNAVGTAPNVYAGVRAPDVVGNIRVDQAWGLFQLSGALHQVNASYNTLTTAGLPTALSELSGHPDSKWGGSVMAALQIKGLPTGKGDDIKIDASYARGDTRNVIGTNSTSPNFAMFGGGSDGAYQSVGFGATTDGIFTPGSGIQLTEAYGVRGAFNHNWDANWSSSLFGSYSAVRYNETAQGIYCRTYTAGKVVSADYSCNPNFNVAQVGVVTRWTPVKNLTFSAEVMYTRLDQNFTGSAVLAASAPKPTAVYQFKDQDTVSMNVRAQRNF
ncbi:MAG: hypothetical protein JWR73_921 [Tardiphaga sp.]|jgi:hypothetical protein|nr:hypothetical protein [Tardiphaga sp.]